MKKKSSPPLFVLFFSYVQYSFFKKTPTGKKKTLKKQLSKTPKKETKITKFSKNFVEKI